MEVCVIFFTYLLLSGVVPPAVHAQIIDIVGNSHWSDCSVTCGEGVRTRTVSECEVDENGLCDFAKPIRKDDDDGYCFAGPCPGQGEEESTGPREETTERQQETSEQGTQTVTPGDGASSETTNFKVGTTQDQASTADEPVATEEIATTQDQASTADDPIATTETVTTQDRASTADDPVATTQGPVATTDVQDEPCVSVAHLVAAAVNDGLEMINLETNTTETIYKEDGVQVHSSAVDWTKHMAVFSYQKSSARAIKSIDLSSRNISTVKEGFGAYMHSMAVDEMRSIIFYFEYYSTIQSINYDGSQLRVITKPACGDCTSAITTDPDNQEIYYNNYATNKIYRCSYDGNCSVLTSALMVCYGMYFDINNRTLYLAGQKGDGPAVVYSYNLESSADPTPLLNIPAPSMFLGVTVRCGVIYMRHYDANACPNNRGPLKSASISGGPVTKHTQFQLYCLMYGLH